MTGRRVSIHGTSCLLRLLFLIVSPDSTNIGLVKFEAWTQSEGFIVAKHYTAQNSKTLLRHVLRYGYT